MTIACPIRSTLPYFGGKRTMAARIVEELDGRPNYCEPFMGSLAVLMARPRMGDMEIANDLWGHAVNLARVLASDRYGELVDRVARTLVHEDLFAEAKSKTPEDLAEGEAAPSVEGVADAHVERAYWLLVYSWIGRNGHAGTKGYNGNIARRFTASGGDPTMRWVSLAESIPAWHERLRRVMFCRMDAIAMVERLEDTDRWAIYADPPYVGAGRAYVVNGEADSVAWHTRLRDVLAAKVHTRVVLSYYPHPLVDELYGDLVASGSWTRREVEVTHATGHQAKRGQKGDRKVELLLMNGRSVVEGGLFA